MLSLYIDPTTAGGLFHLSLYAAAVLAGHLAYSIVMYVAVNRAGTADALLKTAMVGDLAFATAVAFLTEGQTSPSYVFFVFALIAGGVRSNLRATVAVTLLSVTLYLIVIAVSDGVTNAYMMRAVYLAIAGYLIGFFGQQRTAFEARVRAFESKTERHLIARSLHDGYVQALAGMNLRLETCRQLLLRKSGERALDELSDLQTAVAREYDAVRVYLRSLAGVEARARGGTIALSDPRLEISATVSTHAAVGEHILQIALEALHNARRHSNAGAVSIRIDDAGGKISIDIRDDGIGFGEEESVPWAIASRVAELGGQLNLTANGSARLEIVMPKD